ncbi:hypothetical protein HYS31_06085 [Candidatus Woesearchaeota archaeon]|nr:hypothetical protein [Candidatus Woesearchaeota archaeon]
MRKIIFLLAFVFLISLTYSYAIPRNIFATMSNDSDSTTRSDYIFIAGSFSGSGICYPSYNNASLWYQSSTGGTPTYNVGECSVNITRTGGYTETYFTTGMLSPKFGPDMCADIQYEFITVVSNTVGGIGFSDVKRCGNAVGEVCADTAQSGSKSLTLHIGDGNLYLEMTNVLSANQEINATLCYNSTSRLYINNTDTGSQSSVTGTDSINNLTIAINSADTTGVRLKGIAVWNYTLGAPMALPAPPDTTPPSITYYNLTSSTNGCESWNSDKSIACSTSSALPAVQFNTSENAWCAVAGSSSSTALNLNYTDMGSSRNCTGAASGEGSTLHFCTLTSQDEFVYDTSYLFISCNDSSGNQNLTSTSGSLKVSITGLESSRRDSIGIGIQNALLSSYTNYTDLQIYARNLSNGQAKGTFDRAVKKGSKMWAFNGIGVSDTNVNMFNLTPVLYNLEFANTTSERIINLTEALINATK